MTDIKQFEEPEKDLEVDWFGFEAKGEDTHLIVPRILEATGSRCYFRFCVN